METEGITRYEHDCDTMAKDAANFRLGLWRFGGFHFVRLMGQGVCFETFYINESGFYIRLSCISRIDDD